MFQQIQISGRQHCESEIPGEEPFALISCHDPGLPDVTPARKPIERLDLVFHDILEPIPGLLAPTAEHASRVVDFLSRHSHTPRIVFQCEAGVGRSQALAGAWLTANGADWSGIRKNGTYNRRFYRLLLEAWNKPVLEDPLISVILRLKYPPDRFQAFYLSLLRQRHTRWECLAVGDGPNPGGEAACYETRDPRVRYLQTPLARGQWGNYCRTIGLAEADGQFLCFQNDDNLLTPGYLEQLAEPLIHDGKRLSLCGYTNKYSGWKGCASLPYQGSTDVGAWMAHSETARSVPWPSDKGFTADGEYVRALTRHVGIDHVATTSSILYVKI